MIRFEIMGRLGNDAKIENGKNGQFVTFRMASTDFKDDEPTWVTVNAKLDTCKGILPYLKKGVYTRVVGRFKAHGFLNRENKPMVDITIPAIEVGFVEAGNKKADGTQTNVVESQHAAQPIQPQPVQQPVYQQPVQQPVYQQPVQQPVYQQPVQQPVYQQPTQQPVVQPQPIVQNQVEYPSGSADDDLPF